MKHNGACGKKDESCNKQDDVGSAKKARKRSKSVEKTGEQPSPLESKNKQRKLNPQQGEKSALKLRHSFSWFILNDQHQQNFQFDNL